MDRFHDREFDGRGVTHAVVFSSLFHSRTAPSSGNNAEHCFRLLRIMENPKCETSECKLRIRLAGRLVHLYDVTVQTRGESRVSSQLVTTCQSMRNLLNSSEDVGHDVLYLCDRLEANAIVAQSKVLSLSTMSDGFLREIIALVIFDELQDVGDARLEALGAHFGPCAAEEMSQVFERREYHLRKLDGGLHCFERLGGGVRTGGGIGPT